MPQLHMLLDKQAVEEATKEAEASSQSNLVDRAISIAVVVDVLRAEFTNLQ